MFIQTEQTPNPATLKFLLGRPVMDKGTADFAAPDSAGRSPLAKRLFQVDRDLEDGHREHAEALRARGHRGPRRPLTGAPVGAAGLTGGPRRRFLSPGSNDTASMRLPRAEGLVHGDRRHAAADLRSSPGP